MFTHAMILQALRPQQTISVQSQSGGWHDCHTRIGKLKQCSQLLSCTNLRGRSSVSCCSGLRKGMQLTPASRLNIASSGKKLGWSESGFNICADMSIILLTHHCRQQLSAQPG